MRSPRPPAPAAGGRFIAGDPLRAVAAVSVLAYHAAFFSRVHPGAPLDLRPAYGHSAGNGLAALHAGLFLFFVLSGYLISGPFVNAFIDGRQLPQIGSYLRNRALRIVPAFWAVTTALIVIHQAAGASPVEIASIYAFMQSVRLNGSTLAMGLGPAWTLHVELLFYLLVPCCALGLTRGLGPRLGPRGRLATVLGLCSVIYITSLAASHLNVDIGRPRALGFPLDYAWQHSIVCLLFAFMPGVALAALEPSMKRLLPTLRGADIVPFALVAIGAAALALFAFVGSPQDMPPGRDTMSRLVVSAGTGLLVAAALAFQWLHNRAWAVLDNPVLRWVGVRSYSVYLVHTAILIGLAGWVISATAPGVQYLSFLAAGLILALIASAVSYQLVERPALALRHRWRQPPRDAGSAAETANASSRGTVLAPRQP